jgi:hypothetical protein
MIPCWWSGIEFKSSCVPRRRYPQFNLALSGRQDVRQLRPPRHQPRLKRLTSALHRCSKLHPNNIVKSALTLKVKLTIMAVQPLITFKAGECEGVSLEISTLLVCTNRMHRANLVGRRSYVCPHLVLRICTIAQRMVWRLLVISRP